MFTPDEIADEIPEEELPTVDEVLGDEEEELEEDEFDDDEDEDEEEDEDEFVDDPEVEG